MSAFLGDAARASLTVAVALLLFAAVARGLLWAGIDDARALRLARQYIEPLGAWCLVALAVNLFAVGARGDLSFAALAPAVVAGVVAALRLWADDDAWSRARTAAPPGTAAAQPAPTAAAASPPPASAPDSLWTRDDHDEPVREDALWSR
jgi:hypothetical protein